MRDLFQRSSCKIQVRYKVTAGVVMTVVNPVDWLLESEIATIRYQTLTGLLRLPEHDPQVVEAYQAVQTTGPVRAILDGQAERGSWTAENSFYTPKYTSTHWNMVLLVELGVDGRNPGFQRGAAYMLATTRQILDDSNAEKIPEWSCFWGNLLRYALHAGLEDDQRVQNIVSYLAFTGNKGGWRCGHNCGEACSWGAARTLWGLAALPSRNNDSAVQDAIRSGIALLIERHNPLLSNYPGAKVHPIWSRLNFPLFYQSDRLFLLRILKELGELGHPAAREMQDALAVRQNPLGRWKGASPFRHRTWPGLGGPAETNRWVTLQALSVLS